MGNIGCTVDYNIDSSAISSRCDGLANFIWSIEDACNFASFAE